MKPTLALLVFIFAVTVFTGSSAAQSNNARTTIPTFSTNVVLLQPLKEPKAPSSLSTYLSLLIAACLCVVAFQQYRLARSVAAQQKTLGTQQYELSQQQHALARERFKLDLFEKRFAVYKATAAVLAEIIRDGTIEYNRSLQFARETQDAAFLFEQPIVDYLESLYKQSITLTTLRHSYDRLPVGENRNELIHKESNLLAELTGEITKLKDVFGPYLKFKHWS